MRYLESGYQVNRSSGNPVSVAEQSDALRRKTCRTGPSCLHCTAITKIINRQSSIVNRKSMLYLIMAAVLAVYGCKKQEPEPVPRKPAVKAVEKPAPAEPNAASLPVMPTETVAEEYPIEAPAKAVEARLVRLPTDPVKATEALQQAVAKGDFEQVKSLVADGADVNAKAKNDVTPLHIALVQGHEDVAMLLINNGADMNAKMGDGTTPLHFAAMRNCKIIAQFLVDEGADINAASEIQGTPLHVAVSSGHREIVELLVAGRADLNAKDRMGQTPLIIARQKRQTEVIDLLIANGAQE